MRRTVVALSTVLLLLGAACGDDGEPIAADRFPDVVAVEVVPDGDGTVTVHTTLSSPYDSAERYADAWRILNPDGTVLGVRELTHHHAGEQPFTRSLAGVAIPEGTTELTVEGRDQANGWGGATVTVTVPPPLAP